MYLFLFLSILLMQVTYIHVQSSQLGFLVISTSSHPFVASLSCCLNMCHDIKLFSPCTILRHTYNFTQLELLNNSHDDLHIMNIFYYFFFFFWFDWIWNSRRAHLFSADIKPPVTSHIPKVFSFCRCEIWHFGSSWGTLRDSLSTQRDKSVPPLLHT